MKNIRLLSDFDNIFELSAHHEASYLLEIFFTLLLKKDFDEFGSTNEINFQIIIYSTHLL